MANGQRNELSEQLIANEKYKRTYSTAKSLGFGDDQAEIIAKKFGKDLDDRKRKRLNEKEEGFYEKFQQFTGIRLTFANILRQSQILNRFVGSTFQLLGGLIDIMLISLAPVITAILSAIQRLFPAAVAFGRVLSQVYGAVEAVIETIRNALPEPIRNILSSENAVLAASMGAVGLLLFRVLSPMLSVLRRILAYTITTSRGVSQGNVQSGFIRRNSARTVRGLGFVATAVGGLAASSSVLSGGDAGGSLLGFGLSTAGFLALAAGGPAGIGIGAILSILGIAAPFIANAIANNNKRVSRGYKDYIRTNV